MKFLLKIALTVVFLFFLSFFFTDTVCAATFDIAPGDVNGLISAINTANSNGVADTINLATNSIYTLTAVDNTGDFANGLPIINSDITINGNGSTIQRDNTSPQFRIFYLTSPGQLTLNNVTVSGGNVGVAPGGGIRNWFGGLTVNNTSFLFNNGGAGGAIATVGSTEITSSIFSDNTANQGGGVFIEGGIVNMSANTFTRNHVDTWGGAVATYGSTVNISGGTITNNTANYNGGGIFIRSGSTTISNSAISSNVADIGGGIHNQGTLEVNNSSVSDNTARGNYGDGGGISNYFGSLTVMDSTISRDSAASRGGGIYSEGPGIVQILRTTISINSAGSRGGAMLYATAYGIGSLTISHSVISDNTSRYGGGGINTENGGTVNITDSIVSHNIDASGVGGALLVDNPFFQSGTATLRNNCFTGNTDTSVYNWAPELLDAIYNWWGAANGPSGVGSGSGDSISTNVAFAPFLTTPPVGCTPPNQPPVANAGGPYNVNEGGTVALTGSGSDPDGDPVTFSWDLNNDGTFETPGQNVTFSAANLDGPSNKTVVLQVCDDKNACTTSNATVNIVNSAPAVGSITAPVDPVQVNTAISTGASFTDPGVLDTHTALWNWGDGTSSVGVVTEINGSGTVTGNHTYAAAGVYTITVTVTDKDGASGQSIFQYVVIFDSTAGFVTGAGFIDSPSGAYPQDPTVTGRARFGFSVKYLPGDSAPNGGSQFKFKIAGINFTSTSYQWLVISGIKATFQGIGTNNGSGNYTFFVSTIDGSPDKYRIKITDNSTNTVFYDNEMGNAETADPTTSIAAGSIVIH